MVKQLLAIAPFLVASQSFGLDWQRPDCSAFDSESVCINSYKNTYRQEKQRAFREAGLSFWYYERADFSDNEKIEEAFENKLEGALLVSFTIEKDGSVSGVALKDKTSEGVSVYAAPVLAAVKNWQFVPMEAARPNQEWLFPFIFSPDDCEQDGEGASCDKEGT